MKCSIPIRWTAAVLALMGLSLAVLPAAAQSDGDFQDEYALQWGLEAINAGAAFDYLGERGLPSAGDGVVIAISDAGLDPTHPELSHAIQPGLKRGITDNHGMFIAGIIAAAEDGRGMAGVAPGAVLVPIDEDVAAHIAQAAEMGARVISMSWADDASPDLEAALKTAASYDAVLVTSGGQGDEPGHQWPIGYASDPEIGGQMIVTVAIDQARRLVSFGCGQRPQAQIEYCLAAPGEQITGAVAAGFEGNESGLFYEDGITLARDGGTSYATPFVAASAAILRAARPDLSAADVVSILLQSAARIHAPGEDPGYLSPSYGWGVLDLNAAARMAVR